MTGIDMLHVPYRGAGPMLTDLLGGQRLDGWRGWNGAGLTGLCATTASLPVGWGNAGEAAGLLFLAPGPQG
jgi:hypothetical protein